MARDERMFVGLPVERFADRVPRVDVIVARPGMPVKGRIACQRVVGSYVHWTGERTVPCLGDPQDCQHCFRQVPSRWKGYLAVLFAPSNRIALVQLTVESVASDILLSDPKANLLGLHLEVQRSGKSKTSRLTAKVSGEPLPIVEISEDGIKTALIRLWRGQGRKK